MPEILPVQFRKSSDSLTTVDYIDAITGVGYKKFYLCGGTNSTGNTYFLTTDSSIRTDSDNSVVTGNAQDVDFDISIGSSGGFTVAAADAIIVAAVGADNGQNQTVTWKVRHVDSAATETDLGTAVGATITGGAGTEQYIKTTRIALTRKRFSSGEKLRLNFVTSSGANCFVYYDPSGLNTQSVETPNYTLTTWVLIPIEVDL